MWLLFRIRRATGIFVSGDAGCDWRHCDVDDQTVGQFMTASTYGLLLLIAQLCCHFLAPLTRAIRSVDDSACI
jgi:hypothetical protein